MSSIFPLLCPYNIVIYNKHTYLVFIPICGRELIILGIS